MTNAVKGGLLSALVFPGAGQIALKRYQRGAVLIVTVLAGLVLMVAEVSRQVVRILERDSPSGATDPEAMARAVAEATSLSGSVLVNILLLAMAVCWIYSAVDAFRIGKELDANREPSRR